VEQTLRRGYPIVDEHGGCPSEADTTVCSTLALKQQWRQLWGQDPRNGDVIVSTATEKQFGS